MHTLVVDNRETRIIDLLDPFKADISIKQLLIGDFYLVPNIETNSIPVVIVERKTVQDLSASIIDKRFHEQKERLLQTIKSNTPTHTPIKIVYVIEGFQTIDEPDIATTCLPKTTLVSCIMDLVVEPNFCVYHTANLQETCDLLMLLQKRLDKKGGGGGGDPNATATAKKKFIIPKKSKNAKENPFLYILTSIPGIGLSIAIPIVEKYKTLYNLCCEYTKNENVIDRQELLSNIKAGNRTVGKSASIKIYNALTTQAESEEAANVSPTQEYIE
jgi:ERCC4-type nuclease